MNTYNMNSGDSFDLEFTISYYSDKNPTFNEVTTHAVRVVLKCTEDSNVFSANTPRGLNYVYTALNGATSTFPITDFTQLSTKCPWKRIEITQYADLEWTEIMTDEFTVATFNKPSSDSDDTPFDFTLENPNKDSEITVSFSVRIIMEDDGIGFLSTNNDNRFSIIVKQACSDPDSFTRNMNQEFMLIKFQKDNQGLQITKTVQQMFKQANPIECPIVDVALLDVSDPDNVQVISDQKPSVKRNPVILEKNALDLGGSRFKFVLDPLNLYDMGRKYELQVQTALQTITAPLKLKICGYEKIDAITNPLRWVYQQSDENIIIPRLSFESSFRISDPDCKLVDYFLVEDGEEVMQTGAMRKINHVNMEFEAAGKPIGTKGTFGIKAQSQGHLFTTTQVLYEVCDANSLNFPSAFRENSRFDLGVSIA